MESNRKKLKIILSAEDDDDNRLLAKFNIVIADDDEEDCLLVKKAVSTSLPGVATSCVNNGEELIQYLYLCGTEHEHIPCPDIILLDINMPKVNGFDALKIIRADDRFKSIPVVMLSTSGDTHNVNLSYKLGANSFFIKPIRFDALVRIISILGTYWFNLASIPPSTNSYRDEPPVRPMTTASILIVDDSVFARKILVRILRMAGHHTIEAADEKTALDSFRTMKPDLVLLDLRAAGIQGQELIQKFREIDAKARVIIATDTGEVITKEEIDKTGALGLFFKPILSESILQSIDSALAHRDQGEPDER